MAIQLNGTNQFLTVATTNAFSFPGDFTISLMGRLNGLNPLNNASYFTDFRTTTQTKNCTFGVINSGGNSRMYGFCNGVDAVGTTNIPLNSNFHLVYRKAGTAFRFYFDGSDNDGFSSSYNQPNAPCVIGSRYTQSTEYVNGVISELAVWNVSLDNLEISALTKGFTPDQIRPQSLTFYAPLIRDLQDVRGGHVITNNGGATVATHPRIIT